MNGHSRPLVSFVVAVRQGALGLQRCLASIRGNAYPHELVEIIVVDHESTDGCAIAVRGHGAIVIKSTAGSIGAHRNRGARAAIGGVIAFADSEHEINRYWIETAVTVLSCTGVSAWLGGGNVAVKRTAFEKVGGFDATVTAREERDLCKRLRLAGHRIVSYSRDQICQPTYETR